uniref:Retrovirus-related Pol polyprotein from transposon TNT 1-94 n=1 Tax=Tanacetum cinerariifolium TaxID=118510 RepID=A0A699I1B7_TANCI|nr:retrovirus-related Pol polyprotein from transposon TNT 1-94 [Tanacetum cinerariifolium]
MQSQEYGAVLDEEELLFLAGEQTNNFDANVDDHPVRDLALNDDNIFQVYECDAFDSDVNDEPTTQSIFIANLSSAGPTNQQAGLSNALILSKFKKMSRDVLTVGSTMRISLLYRGEYSQWVERFMNYLEEQTDGEAMINSIKNGDQPLPHVTQVSIAGTSSTEQPPLKDKSMWSNQEKKI